MTNTEMLLTAKQLVLNHINANRPAQYVPFDLDDVYIVWFCETIQNWKALVSTDVVDGVYYEVTHNGDQNETYVDVYHRSQHIVVGDEE